MKKIGIIADTHGHLDSKVVKHFKDCHEIWHAGDFGTLKVAQKLEKVAPLRGVYGNIDRDAIRKRFPEDNKFDCEGLSVWMTHIGGKPGKYDSRINLVLKTDPPDIFVCGHSHILKIERDTHLENMLYINPGAAGREGFHQVRTIVRIDIEKDTPKNAKVIELGKR